MGDDSRSKGFLTKRRTCGILLNLLDVGDVLDVGDDRDVGDNVNHGDEGNLRARRKTTLSQPNRA